MEHSRSQINDHGGTLVAACLSTPFFPASGPATRSFNGLHPKSNFQAIEWSETLESEMEIAAALSQIAVTLSETDPKRAANLLSESAIPGRDFEVAIVQVIQRWSAQSAPDAAEWVGLFPPGAAREAGIKIIAEHWLSKDTPTAFAWLDQMEDVELRKETARAMEGIILQQSPATRDAWLQHANPQIRIELEQQRDQALKDVGNNIQQGQQALPSRQLADAQAAELDRRSFTFQAEVAFSRIAGGAAGHFLPIHP